MKRLAFAMVFAATSAAAGQAAPPPTDLTTIDVGTELTLGPFITDNFLPGAAGAKDPVNLVFLDTDPRAIRQQLMQLHGGDRPGWSFLPSGASGCRWIDAMGYEQAAYLEPEGWVGDAVQLACATAVSPLGREYRFHVRLFRSGPHTIGGAHFEINVPGTAEHEVLSWDMAREFVRDEMVQLGVDPATIGTVPLYPPTSLPALPGTYFRTVRGPVNAYVWQTQFVLGGNAALMARLGLAPPPGSTPPQSMPSVPIPATGLASVFSPAFTYVPVRSDVTLTDSRMYSVSATPKPFCHGELIQITGGPLTFTLRVQTNRSGKYQRTYTVSGNLRVKALPDGPTQDAVISESHRGMLTDHHGQVTEEVSQVLLPGDGALGQSLYVAFGAGQTDYWIPQQNCAIE
jgi:hypothetical protein